MHSTVDHLEIIRRYYEGCSTADAALLRSVLSENVAHYATDMDAIVGAEPLIAFFLRFAPAVQAVWHVDHGIVQGDEAVIEWTMQWQPTERGVGLKRGAEWYVFDGTKIREIRAYYTNPYAKPDHARAALKGFDYDARGYTTLERTPAG